MSQFTRKIFIFNGDKTVHCRRKRLIYIWHKQCFKCQGCNMTLNMRTYKGFNKQPYCEA
ncbi:GSCOCG00009451001-RA-CDS [Cotesia congregata]|nr:GSCOCG00009451001-RA-CDS [Cotesia congregata]